MGYDARDPTLVVNEAEAKTVNHIYQRYIELGSVKLLKEALDRQGIASKRGKMSSVGRPFSRGALYALLRNPIYIGKLRHKEKLHNGLHIAIIDKDKAHYYHPDMLGSWSVKAVLPTIAPELDYASLTGIREGN